ncbi:uncharacterized protein LOC110845828 isoform X1 [Folsomia candida]|uniref:uncharacterized protein LOC110845828 isoform X1 n=1 Tax=Folsomia candida TaxID=158441 RepID=UPI000B907308|nr:uncharacterized protein LOC110845828 isoform X1 [Folsomia candida]XP_035705797.1 uncharacterized protein LOC110845828 isoform X1 [Folsomia candida]XP_035705798.1 uncharacterized protein LOC110845828 isoform X1 [Folsomia candida]XP_035705799.1 uncharacterized protein LOC110845828 isoform X1 [Folsomia candida]XP_035705800.1 uncharacterized protein LOC110845828 isoform X1 [Folsomia candida]
MIWTMRGILQGGGKQCCWCLKLLKFSILVLTFLSNVCEASSNDKSSSDQQLSHHRSHSPWSESSASSILPWDEPTHMPNVTPLVLKEVRESNPQKKSSSKKSATSKKSKSSKTGADGSDDASRGGKGKSGSRTYESDNNNFADGRDSKVDLVILREKALDFGSLVVNFLSQEVLRPQTETGKSRGARGILSDLANNFKLERKEGEGGGGGEGGDRGVIDWLARLIGVQGKTLGEFLREYQVHVLYDLVFTFFKWIFFLYAGLLIP